MEEMGFGGIGEYIVHSRIHTAMAEGRPHSLLNLIPCGENGSFLSYTTRKVVAA